MVVEKLKIGVIINPVAGMGAKLAWKGTDNIEQAWELIENDHPSESYAIAKRAFKNLQDDRKYEILLTASIDGLKGKIVYEMPHRSTPADTAKATEALVKNEIDLIVFVGGDGTAADVAKVAFPNKIPILGVPSGVKIFSGVFLHRPEDLIVALNHWNGKTKLVDVEDLDEESYRKGTIKAKQVYATYVPLIEQVQLSKSSFWDENDTEILVSIAERIKEEKWLTGTIVVGSGTTLYEIFRNLGLEKSLLGVDIYEDGKMIKSDATYHELETINANEIWITPIGRQGHLFGRGNRQIPPQLIRKVGKQGLRIFATPTKMANTPLLFFDTGDPSLDQELRGYYKVIIGFHESVIKKAM